MVLEENRGARGGVGMMDTKLLLQKIAALRTRLDEDAARAATTQSGESALEKKVQQGATHNRLIESALRIAAVPEATPTAGPARLSGRGARLLRKGREALQALRAIADDTHFGSDEDDMLQCLHRNAVAMIEIILRTIQSFPPSMSAQLRLCDGLEVVLTDAEARIAHLEAGLSERRRAADDIDGLADYLRALAATQSVGMAPLQQMAERILGEARANAPLRFLSAAPTDPARFAAAHGLTVAQVVARVIRDDAEWQPQAPLAVMAALVHDVGMVRVPADLLLTDGPLDSEERRLVEKHTIVAESILEKLWPGGGWPVEAACTHHERNDGTGYPLGHTGIRLSPFAKLLAVCDVYAALCVSRPHRDAFDTRTALTETLLLAERDCLDKACAERLLRLSFYPVGSAVELSDGSLGVVAAAHTSERGLTQPDRPVVFVILDAEGRRQSSPAVLDLLDHRDRSIIRGLSPSERQAKLGPHYPAML